MPPVRTEYEDRGDRRQVNPAGAFKQRSGDLRRVFAAACFAVVLLSETGNRPTVICIGAVGVVIAVTVRLYAAALGNLRVDMSDFAVIANHVEALTPREHQVARLAARGMSASEIAQHLHISERTVESHLANAYAKLGIHSRAALRKIGADLVDR